VPSGGLPKIRSVDGLSVMPASPASFCWSISVKEPDALGGDVVLQTFDGLLEAVGAFDADDAIARLGMELRRHDQRGGSDARKA
jgi:hypothetical protein